MHMSLWLAEDDCVRAVYSYKDCRQCCNVRYVRTALFIEWLASEKPSYLAKRTAIFFSDLSRSLSSAFSAYFLA